MGDFEHKRLWATLGWASLAGLLWAMTPAMAATAAPPPAKPAASAPEAAQKPAPAQRRLSLDRRPWTGDFDVILQRRVVRFLIPYSRTLYFNDKGRERGISAELAREFERYLNVKYKKELGNRPITVYLIPTTRDRLLTDLGKGLGDIAAGNLTVTPAREKIADFVAPADRKPVRELVATGPSSPPIATLEDLSGKKVSVRATSSYYESLIALNARLKAAGKPPVTLEVMPDALEDEDLLEMLNAGTIDVVVADDWMLSTWAKVLPRIKVRDDLVLRSEGYIGWAYRKNSPALRGVLEAFYAERLKKQGTADYLLARYMKNIKQIHNNRDPAELKRFEDLLALFEKYGKQYGFDALMLAAQGYQESQLNQKARSHVGAIGIMQVMPATGREMQVGNITIAESNVHAAAKYMNRLMVRYFADAQFSPDDRALFAFASYNAGPNRIARLRKEAEARGLNPNQWFNNVEIIVAEKVGIETTTYVRNIYKYYAAYRLIMDARLAREKLIESL